MFLIGNGFVWTREGLRKISELKSRNQILGVDREGIHLWLDVDSQPILKSKKELLMHIILDRSEVHVAPTCELCGYEGILRAGEIKENDKLEIFAEPKYVLSELRNMVTKFVDNFYI